MGLSPYDKSRAAQKPQQPAKKTAPKKKYPWKGIIGQCFSLAEFEAYCESLQWQTWRPSFIVLHNTWIPNLARFPDGFTEEYITQGLVSHYRDKYGWSAGAHVYVDDRQIWVFTPLTVQGVHSPSYNLTSIGVEMLGDYDDDAFDSGRGLQVRCNTVDAMATLCVTIGLDPCLTMLHREDSATNHKRCPGLKVKKDEILAELVAAVSARTAGEHDPADMPAGEMEPSSGE